MLNANDEDENEIRMGYVRLLFVGVGFSELLLSFNTSLATEMATIIVTKMEIIHALHGVVPLRTSLGQ